MRAIHRAGLCLAAVSAIAVPAAVVFAQAGGTPPVKMGQPRTKAEAETRAMALFDRLDTDHDGYVARAEADAATARMHARMAERMKGWRDARFARMDANKDGSISRPEYDAAGAGHMAMRDGAAPPPAAPGSPPAAAGKHGMMGRGMMAGGMMGHGMMAGAMFDRIDTDHDGRVSRAEAKAVVDMHFAMRAGRSAGGGKLPS